jgi:hypothetical protein
MDAELAHHTSTPASHDPRSAVPTTPLPVAKAIAVPALDQGYISLLYLHASNETGCYHQSESRVMVLSVRSFLALPPGRTVQQLYQDFVPELEQFELRRVIQIAAHHE